MEFGGQVRWNKHLHVSQENYTQYTYSRFLEFLQVSANI